METAKIRYRQMRESSDVAAKLHAKTDSFINRGIVRVASKSARNTIIMKVIGSFLFQLLTAGLIILAWYAITNSLSGGAAAGIFAIGAILAFLADEGKWYFISWLADDPEYVYK